jgi:hypothetical protein
MIPISNEEYNMLTETQMSDRLELIRKIAKKRDRQAAFKARIKAKAAQTVGWMDEAEKPAKKPTQNLTEKYDGYNENHYTDASKYAKEHYGERYNQTTRFDNDWGDY